MSTPETLPEAPARMTLFDIETAWLELIQARAEAEGIPLSDREQAIAACDQALAEYVAREVAKVDGIRGVVRTLTSAAAAAKAESDYQTKRAQSCEAMITRIKGFVQSALEASGKKRIDGRTGYLTIKGNGGVQPLVIQDPALVPDCYCRMEGWISADLWQGLMKIAELLATEYHEGEDYSLKRVPANELIRSALLEDCPVPGAHLEPRGQHVEIC